MTLEEYRIERLSLINTRDYLYNKAIAFDKIDNAIMADKYMDMYNEIKLEIRKLESHILYLLSDEQEDSNI